jgi:flagellin
MLSVGTNTGSLIAQNYLNRSSTFLDQITARLSSGKRITSAKDDAAGLAVAMKMEGQARGYAVAQRNIGDGISYLDVADNTLRDINDTLARMRELTVQAQNGTYDSDDLSKMDEEFSELANEIKDLQTRATFNGKTVIGGTADIIVDANGNKISIGGGTAVTDLTSNSVDSAANAATALTAISGAITGLASSMAKVGAYQSRLERAMSSSMAIEEAQWTSYGRIMDADIAKETANLAKYQIMQQASVSMLAQANQFPQLALSLLR